MLVLMLSVVELVIVVFFCKQKTAYEMRISDWSSDVCSSDLAGRRLTEPSAGPLFGSTWEEDDIASGTIYVLRSLSDHPFVSEHRQLIHKIGVTGGKVETRIANAEKDATYLLAAVEVVATYKLADINRTKLENLFHRIFAPAQLDLTIQDRFGHPVRPREWFLEIGRASCRERVCQYV